MICLFVILRLDGDYAYFQNIDNLGEELMLVARALLPMDINDGTKLHYEMLQYTIIG